MTYFDRSLHLPTFTPNLELTPYHVDFETGSKANLKKTGVYRYAEDDSTRVWCMAYGQGHNDVDLWYPGQPFPFELLDHVMAGGRINAHNAMFERIIWNIVLVRRMGLKLPELQPEQMDCTMVRAQVKALPASLDELSAYLELSERKDSEGAALMKKMMKPYKGRKTKGENPDEWYWHDTPENLQRLGEYCKQDVRTELVIDQNVSPMTPAEHALWCLDQRINDRGVEIDVLAASRAEQLILETKADLDEQLKNATGRDFRAGQVKEITAYLEELGYDTSAGLAKDKAKALLDQAKGADDAAETVLTIRAEYSKSSTAKINAMLNSACADLRSRGNFAHHGASTGRWAGRLVQLQNLPRTKSQMRALLLIQLLLDLDCPDDRLFEVVGMVFDQPMIEVSNAIRSFVKARKGCIFVQRDFSNIEGRINAWIAGEIWKLQAFKDYDTILGYDQVKGKKIRAGHDLYHLGAGAILGKDPGSITDDERQAYGKVPELALGYGGGVGAFQSMARIYGVSVTDEKADEIKLGWRQANPQITASWREYEQAIIEAISAPGRVVSCLNNRVRYLYQDGFLYCRLPSGRVLSYAKARLEWGVDSYGRNKREILYAGYKQLKGADGKAGARIWSENLKLYGGKICENVVQAIARDILTEAMLRCEARGWPIVMHVHDEVVLEILMSVFEALGPDEVDQVMNELPEWAAGLPMATGGWHGHRYRKD